MLCEDPAGICIRGFLHGMSGRRAAFWVLDEGIVGEAVEERGFLCDLEDRMFDGRGIRPWKRIEIQGCDRKWYQ
jgi:hypothetical protein